MNNTLLANQRKSELDQQTENGDLDCSKVGMT